MRLDEIKPVNALVAVFDFLGFKALRRRKTTAGLFHLFVNGLLPSIEHSAAGGGKLVEQDGQQRYVPNPGPMSVSAAVFSDTIVLWIPGDSYDCFLRMLHASQGLIRSGFVGHGAVLRGGIGYGDFVPNSLCRSDKLTRVCSDKLSHLAKGAAGNVSFQGGVFQ